MRSVGRVLLASTLAVLAACTGAASPVTAGRPPSSVGTVSASAAQSPSASPSRAATPIQLALARGAWTRAIDGVVAGADVSVAVGIGDRIVYLHDGARPRRLASNEKLLTTMAALDRFGPAHRFRTVAAAAARVTDGVLDGDLWLVGSGDPELDAGDLGRLADRLRRAGLRWVTGSVLGDRGAFDRGWWAPGWLPGISRRYVTRPTALVWAGNAVADPEERAAAALTAALRADGITVGRGSGSGRAPSGLTRLAAVGSDPLGAILARQNHGSINLDAEVLTKALGALAGDASTASGAAAIGDWARTSDVVARVRDGSGLSDRDRTSARDLVTLLLLARRRAWFRVFLRSLPEPGEGTLAGRLAGVPVRAKTGTLFVRPTSALSGYVRTADGALAAFTVLTEGLGSAAGEAIEDAVVRILAGAALGP